MEKKDNQGIKIQKEDLPLLYQLASKESGKAQKGYLWLVRFYVVTLIIGSAILSFSTNDPELRLAVTIAGSIFLLVSTFFIFVITFRQREKDWYGGRFIAESVKTLAWRYMTRAEPFGANLDAKDLDSKFIDALSDILKYKQLSWEQDTAGVKGSQISEKMRKVRELDAKGRLEVYLAQRINDQWDWYSKKAKECRKWQNIWFMVIIFSQILAFMVPYLIFVWRDCPVNVTSVIAVIVSSLFAWIQVKRYQELAQSYGIAATDLMMIAERAKHIGDNDPELSKFVVEAENAISREHTLWIAKSGTIHHEDRK